MKSEGKALPIIAFRLTTEKYQRFEEFLQKAGFIPLKKGECMSDAYRKAIELLLTGDLPLQSVGVNEKKKRRVNH